MHLHKHETGHVSPAQRRPLQACCGQWAVWRAIVEYKCAHDGNSPTLAEIMRRTGLSKTTVATHILKLTERGLVRRNENNQLEIKGVYSPPVVD